jgi:sn-glycerol 3-phosphate transport system permease protein
MSSVDAAVDLRPGEEPAAAAPAPRSRRFSRRVREAGLGYLLLLPAFLVFAVFIFYPFFRNFYLGFFSTPLSPDQPKDFVGIDQYRDVLSSSEFLDSLKVTITFAIITVPVGIALGILLAVLAHQKLKGVGIYRMFFSSTVATSIAVASVIFGTLLSPQVGLLQGIQTEPSILQNADPIIDINLPVIRSFIPSVALVAVAVTTIWQNLGLSFILMSAGLQAVPEEVQEAAEVDGAGPWSRFWHITLPLLSPTIFFAFVVGSIFAFQTFGQIDLLTPRGGPLKSTNVLTYFIYDQLQFAKNDGKAAVLAIALFGVTLLLTLVQFSFLERRVSYER